MDVMADPPSAEPEPNRPAIPGVHQTRGRRRPSGEPPPLPRALGRSGRFWIVVMAILAVFIVVLAGFQIGNSLERGEDAFVRWFAGMRTPWLTAVVRRVNVLASPVVPRVLGWGTILALLAVRRWRHLVVFVGVTLVAVWLTSHLAQLTGRPRPLGVTILGSWRGPSFPSRPLVALGGSLMGITYTLVVPGRPRELAKWASWTLLAALGFAELYLGQFHPTDLLFGLVLGLALPVVAYRLETPNAIFPVTYRKGRAAHLNLGGARGAAIRQAIRDQLGVMILEIKPFGLAGSGGSSPMRLTVEGEPNRHLFGKLYAKSHMRADRWYKLGRTILYGSLEDEKPYNSVRRLAEYEDYVLRVMHDAGIPCAQSYGFVEISPEREYLLVTEFLEGGVEITEAPVTDAVIDDALSTIRLMWEAGLAHRDVKSANILVRGESIVMIDPAFGELRPSPWRQAVDLANMMVVLGLRTDPDRVYQRALASFTPEEIAEAFAATRGVTMPSQSRRHLRDAERTGRDVLARFRELAPKRPPIRIQRWNLRRVALSVGMALGGLVALSLLADAIRSGAL
jgi:tRNA A-37 threonylcarbamoyl transferase component Bud32